MARRHQQKNSSRPPSRTPSRTRKRRKKARPASRNSSVYVVALAPGALQDKKILEANPDYVPGKPVVYVGMTGLTPEERFHNHKRGHKASRVVRKHGLHLRTRLCRMGLTYAEAVRLEVEMAERLRRKGWAVWQN